MIDGWRFSAHVLLVEDEVASAERFRMTLEGCSLGNFRVHVVSTLEAAQEALDHGAFDALLLDLGLPDSSGSDTVTRCVRRAPDLPVVVITGSDDELLVAQCLGAGADDFLQKSEASPARIAVSLVQVIARRRAEAEYRRLRQLRHKAQALGMADEWLSAYIDRMANHLFVAQAAMSAFRDEGKGSEWRNAADRLEDSLASAVELHADLRESVIDDPRG